MPETAFREASLLVATPVSGVVLQHGVWDVAVREELDRAVVVAQLLLGEDVRPVAVHPAVHADDLLDDAGDGPDVVRDNDDRHAVVQRAERVVELLFEPVVHEVRGLVEDQQLRIGDHSAAEQGALELPARYFAHGVAGRFGDSRSLEQTESLVPVGFRVARAEPAASLQPGEHDLEDRDRECAVEFRQLGHVADQPLLAAEELRREYDFARVGHRSEYGLHKGCLAASVGADDSEKVPVIDLQIDIPKRFAAVVCDADVVE